MGVPSSPVRAGCGLAIDLGCERGAGGNLTAPWTRRTVRPR